MITAGQVVVRAANVLSDVAYATWSETSLVKMCMEGVRDLSRVLPVFLVEKRDRYSTFQHNDDPVANILDASFLDAVRVEYPIGQDPPNYLKRLNRDEALFQNEGYYDVIAIGEDKYIVISDAATGATSDWFRIWYRATGTVLPEATTTEIGIPDHYTDLLVQYIYWRAMAWLAADEAANPTSSSSLLMSQLNQIARDARRDYERMVKLALEGQSGQSAVTVWREVDQVSGYIY